MPDKDKNKIKIKIDSEVGELEAVILHKPGSEIENMTPENAKRALYSDILNKNVANVEYEQFSGVLQKVTNVFFVEKLLIDILENKSTKNSLIDKIFENCKYKELRNILIEKDPKQLASLLIEGVPLPKDSLTNYLSEDYFALQPLHNFFYMRDSASAINNNVLINRMANNVRIRESFIMEAIFENHKRFITNTINPELSRSFSDDLTMEGGDILVARKDILLIGMGTRTTSQAIDYIAKKIDSRESVKHIIVQELPHSPESFIHLDMVFTLLDVDKCMIYKPVILRTNKFYTIHITVSNGKIKSIKHKDNIIEALKDLKMDLKPILCGGKHEHNQIREQWHSGANFFAFAPGKIIGYERNSHTIEALDKEGFEVMSAKDVINEKSNIKKTKKVLVTIHGSELLRGGGGARCMTMPIRRKKID